MDPAAVAAGPPAAESAPLLGLGLSALEQWAVANGQAAFRGRQLHDWLYAKGARNIEAVSVLPKAFRDQLLAEGLRVEYTSGASVSESLAGDLKRLEPRRVCYVEPGEWGVREQLRATLRAAQVEFTELPDRHFLCTHEEFERQLAEFVGKEDATGTCSMS